MVRELITKNEIINENWMCTVSTNADGRMSFQKMRSAAAAFCVGGFALMGLPWSVFRALSEPLDSIVREGALATLSCTKPSSRICVDVI
jgi:hypothetical protein